MVGNSFGQSINTDELDFNMCFGFADSHDNAYNNIKVNNICDQRNSTVLLNEIFDQTPQGV